MHSDHINGFEEDENRFADILRQDVDNFLASSVESDFIFNESERFAMKPRRLFETMIQRGQKTQQSFIGARFYTFSFVLLSLLAVGVCFLLFLRFHSSSVHNRGTQNTEVAREEKEPTFRVPDIEPIPFRFSPANFYGRGIEVLDSFSQKYWTDEVDFVFDMTHFLTSWSESETNEHASSSQTLNRNEDYSSVLEDAKNFPLSEAFSPQEIVLATLSVSALVFTIEKFYNTEETGRRTEL